MVDVAVIGVRLELVTYPDGYYWIRARERQLYDTFDGAVGTVKPVLPDDGSWRPLFDQPQLLNHFHNLVQSLDLISHIGFQEEAFVEMGRELHVYRLRYMLNNGSTRNCKNIHVRAALGAQHRARAS